MTIFFCPDLEGGAGNSSPPTSTELIPYLGISDVARKFGIPPKVISQLFYERRLNEEVCPIVNGRRRIPASYVDIIAMVLRRHGKIGGVR
jgi:hypothetical protein